MASAVRKLSPSEHATNMRTLEDKAKSEISELYLLLKGGDLSDEERALVEERIKKAILAIQIEQKKACCK